MWINKQDLSLVCHSEEFLSEYRRVMQKEYKTPEVNYLGDVPIIVVCSNYLEQHYTNVDDLVGEYLYVSSENTVIDSSPVGMIDRLDEGFTFFKSYGVTDLYEDEHCCIESLLKFYPEILQLGSCSENKFALVLTLCEGDFRFHKNGGYRGVDKVEEHVYESPAAEYLMFTVVKLND